MASIKHRHYDVQILNLDQIFFQCSARCGKGMQTRHVVCLSPSVDGRCDRRKRPLVVKQCDMGSCDNIWVVSHWSNVNYNVSFLHKINLLWGKIYRPQIYTSDVCVFFCKIELLTLENQFIDNCSDC